MPTALFIDGPRQGEVQVMERLPDRYQVATFSGNSFLHTGEHPEHIPVEVLTYYLFFSDEGYHSGLYSVNNSPYAALEGLQCRLEKHYE